MSSGHTAASTRQPTVADAAGDAPPLDSAHAPVITEVLEEVVITEDFVEIPAGEKHALSSTPTVIRAPGDGDQSPALGTDTQPAPRLPTSSVPASYEDGPIHAVPAACAAPIGITDPNPRVEAQAETRTSPTRRGPVQLVLLGAFGVDACLYMVVVPFLPSRAQGLGASPLATSALFAMYSACLFAATPLAGWLTDRLGARQVLLIGLVALAAATLLFAYAPGLPLLFAARGTQGAAASVTWTAGLTLVAQLYTMNERPLVFSRIVMASGIGTLIGPPLGGLLYTFGGFRTPFLTMTGLVLLDGLLRILFLPSRHAIVVARPPAVRARIRLRQDRPFVAALLVTLAGAGMLAMIEPSVPLLLTTRFALAPFSIGLVFGAVTLVFIVIQPLVAAVTRWVGAYRGVAFGLAFCAGGLMLEATAATALQAELALMHLAIGLALILVPALELLTRAGQARHAPYGAIFGAYNLAYAAGQFLGPLLAGAALTVVGTTNGFALLSLAPALLGFIVVWRQVAARRR